MAQVENRKLLIVEDNENLLEEMVNFFRSNNNCVAAANTLTMAKEIYLNENNWDAIVLDLILPDGEGLEIFKYLTNPPPPVIILTDLSGDEDILIGFDAGATDYIAKPCSMQVLQARIAMRLMPKSDAKICASGLQIDANLRTVFYKNQPLALTSCEFNILFFLIKNAGKFFTSDEIYEKVWNAVSLQTKTVRKHISSLRQKIKEIAPDKTLILTDFGHGYCFANDGANYEK